MSISQDSLTKVGACSDFSSERDLNVAEGICDCLVTLVSSNMQCIIADTIKTSCFLRQVSAHQIVFFASHGSSAHQIVFFAYFGILLNTLMHIVW